MRSFGQALLWVAGVGILLLIPAKGGKIFEAVTNKLESKEADRRGSSAANSAAADEEAFAKQTAADAGQVTEEDAEEAKERYMDGLKYFQSGDYEAAKKEWEAAAGLDPSNQNVKTGLKRISALPPARPE